MLRLNLSAELVYILVNYLNFCVVLLASRGTPGGFPRNTGVPRNTGWETLSYS